MRERELEQMTVTQWQNKVAKDKQLVLNDLQKEFPITSLVKLKRKTWNAIFRGIGKNITYCIKVINEETADLRRSLQDLSYTTTVMLELKHLGFPYVSPPLKSKYGEYIHRCGGYWVIIFPWITSFSRFGLKENQAQTAGVIKKAAYLLSKMHYFSKQGLHLIKHPKTRNIPHAYKPSVWAYESDRLWTRAEQNLRYRKSSLETIRRLYRARKIAEKIIRDNPWFFSNAKNKEIIINGDFRPENILIAPHNAHLIFDFDCTHLDYPEVDIAYGALNFSGQRWFCGQRNWHLCSAFVNAYIESSTNIKISPVHLDLAFRWNILKSLSLSFKEEQILWRLCIYDELIKYLPTLKSN